LSVAAPGDAVSRAHLLPDGRSLVRCEPGIYHPTDEDLSAVTPGFPVGQAGTPADLAPEIRLGEEKTSKIALEISRVAPPDSTLLQI